MEELCTIHKTENAVGKCFRCKRPFCLDCLDVETGQALCPECLKNKTAPAASTPSVPAVSSPSPAPLPEVIPVKPAASAPSPLGGASPLDFKGKGMDDDPLGLLGSFSAPKNAMPPLTPQPPPKPFVPQLSVPSKPLPTPMPSPTISPLPKGFADQAIPVSRPEPTSVGKSPLDLDSLSGEPSNLRPQFPGPPSGSLPPLSYPLGSISGSPVERSKGSKVFSLSKTWSKYLVRRAYEIFGPLARKLRIPTYAAIVVVALAGIGLITAVGMMFKASPVKLAEFIQPLHIVRVQSSQISEMDVTTFSEFQVKMRNLGFTPLIQGTVPQLPSSNFLDVWSKEDVGTYGEIIKLPGQITPVISFVTIFNNGLWYSTNAWKGTSHSEEYLVSEFQPGDTPDQLYVRHIQGIDKKKANGLQVQFMGENRYFAALTDHLRWFLTKAGIPAYKANFELWH